jgi:hypothetical protein
VGDLDPDGIPVGRVPHRADQSRTHGVRDDISGYLERIFLSSQRVVMEAALPDAAADARAPIRRFAIADFARLTIRDNASPSPSWMTACQWSGISTQHESRELRQTTGSTSARHACAAAAASANRRSRRSTMLVTR